MRSLYRFYLPKVICLHTVLLCCLQSIFIPSLNAFSPQSENVDYVYSLFPSKEIFFEQKTSIAYDLKVANQNNSNDVIFVAGGKGGVYVIDCLKQQIMQQLQTKDVIQNLGVSQDGKFIVVADNMKINLFVFDGINLKLSAAADLPSNTNTIADILFNKEETLFYVIAVNGFINAYTIQDQNHIKITGTFNTAFTSLIKGSLYSLRNTATSNLNLDYIYLGDGTNGMVVVRSTLNTSGERSFSIVGKGDTLLKSRAVLLTNDYNYIYVADSQLGFYIGNLQQFYIDDGQQLGKAVQEQQILQIKLSVFWFTNDINPQIQSLAFISGSGNNSIIQKQDYLAVGVRSQGIFLFDIEDRMNPVLFEHIALTGQVLAVVLVQGQSQIYISNGISIRIYDRIGSNLNTDTPNLFNKHQIQQYQFSSASNKRVCYVEEINGKKYYFAAFDAEGVYVNQLIEDSSQYQQNQMKAMSHITYSDQGANTNQINYLQIVRSSSNIYLYVPVQIKDEMIRIYNITNPSNTTYVASLRRESGVNAEYSTSLYCSSDGNFIVITQGSGILLINSTDKVKLFIISSWKSPSQFSGNISSAMMTANNEWIVGSMDGLGLFILSSRIKLQVYLINQFEQYTCIGYSESRYAFAVDYFQGLLNVIDLLSLPTLVIIHALSINGQPNFISFVPSSNPSYIFLTQQDKATISMVQINDQFNMQVVNSFQIGSSNGQSICLNNSSPQLQADGSTSSTFDSIFINNSVGVYELPLKTSVLIHSEMIIMSQGNTSTNSSRRSENIMYVGENICIKLVPIYPIKQMQIISVQYLSAYQYKQEYTQITPQPLPYWIQYNTNTMSFSLQVQKEALGHVLTQNQANNTSIILIHLSLPLSSTDFFYTTTLDSNDQASLTTQTESEWIFNYMIQMGYLSESGDITSLFVFETVFTFTIDTRQKYSKELCDRVKKTFFNSIYFNTINLQVYSSLTFELTKDDSGQHASISTASQKSIQMVLTVPQGIGQFVAKQYQGVVWSINQLQNELMIEGSLDNLNAILNDTILFFTKQNKRLLLDDSSQNLTIEINDGVNFPLLIEVSIQQSSQSFLKIQHEMQLQQEYRLQQQFDLKFPDSILYITDPFTITFNVNVFQHEEGFPDLKYKAQYQMEGKEFVDFQQDNWLQAFTSGSEIRVYGTPPSVSLKTNFCVKISATDTYSQITDQFCAKVRGIPISYAINILFSIIIPILIVLALWKYKFAFFNLLSETRQTYSTEFAQIGYFYSKQIPILSNEAQKARLLFQAFILQYETTQRQLIQKIDNIQLTRDRKKKLSTVSQIKKDEQILKKRQQLMNVKAKLEKQKKKPMTISDKILPRNLKAERNKNPRQERLSFKKNIELETINDMKESGQNNEIHTSKENNKESTSPQKSNIFMKQPIDKKQRLDMNSNIQLKYLYDNDHEAESAQFKLSNEKYNEHSTQNSHKPIQSSKKPSSKRCCAKQADDKLLNIQKQNTLNTLSKREPKDKFIENFESAFLKSDGRIDFSKVINEIINSNVAISLHGESFTSNSLKTSLENKNSCLYNSLKCIIARYIIAHDARSNAVYSYIKHYCSIKFDLFTEKDWYFSIVEIDSNAQEIDQNGRYLPFPKLSLKEDILNGILADINIYSSPGSKFNLIQQVNPHLIEQVLFADALGIDTKIPSQFFPSVGESLHLSRQEILCVKTTRQESFCRKLKKCLNFNYIPFCFRYSDLPDWLTLTIQHDVIILEGIPLQQDLDSDILVRIYHQNGIILRQFILQVSEEQHSYKARGGGEEEEEQQDEENSKRVVDEEEHLRQSSILPKLVNHETKSLFIVQSQQHQQEMVTQQKPQIINTLQSSISMDNQDKNVSSKSQYQAYQNKEGLLSQSTSIIIPVDETSKPISPLRNMINRPSIQSLDKKQNERISHLSTERAEFDQNQFSNRLLIDKMLVDSYREDAIHIQQNQQELSINKSLQRQQPQGEQFESFSQQDISSVHDQANRIEVSQVQSQNASFINQSHFSMLNHKVTELNNQIDLSFQPQTYEQSKTIQLNDHDIDAFKNPSFNYLE